MPAFPLRTYARQHLFWISDRLPRGGLFAFGGDDFRECPPVQMNEPPVCGGQLKPISNRYLGRALGQNSPKTATWAGGASLGKGEVLSSILSGSTSLFKGLAGAQGVPPKCK